MTEFEQKISRSHDERLRPEQRTSGAGHRGLVNSAVLRRLECPGYCDILTATRQEVGLRDQAAVDVWLEAHRPETEAAIRRGHRNAPKSLCA